MLPHFPFKPHLKKKRKIKSSTSSPNLNRCQIVYIFNLTIHLSNLTLPTCLPTLLPPTPHFGFRPQNLYYMKEKSYYINLNIYSYSRTYATSCNPRFQPHVFHWLPFQVLVMNHDCVILALMKQQLVVVEMKLIPILAIVLTPSPMQSIPILIRSTTKR